MVACAFATRAMRISFDQIPQRYEKVALTLGCNRAKAFRLVVMPQAKQGILAAGTLAWARALGEFGPILVFAGSTRMHTEVLPTSVYLEIQAGNLKGALAVSIIMIVAAAGVLATLSPHGNETTATMIAVDKLGLKQGEFSLHDLNFEIPEGKYGVLVGKSGCGKTTLLEAVCGLRPINAGRILLGGQEVTSCKPGERGVGSSPRTERFFPI